MYLLYFVFYMSNFPWLFKETKSLSVAMTYLVIVRVASITQTVKTQFYPRRHHQIAMH